ncbi:MAG: hypothetical protein CVT59_04035 [Actinobacteria bacterium HGW-Actinobacteria-1]|nr:MAG: hypothetical protein CVT59_04035 [Actinobacteria bacterium HGW-Actinobacteria-1]
MEEPSREWDQALAGIEPVRFEFPYSGPTLSRDAIIMAVLIPVILVFSMGIAGLTHPSVWDGLWVAVVLTGICEVWLALWYLYRRDREPQVLEFRSGQLLLGRRSPFKQVDQTFDLLEIHDLHRTSGARFGLVAHSSQRVPPAHYLFPEPIGFTYHGRAYSFGAAPMTAEAVEQVMAAARAYDAAVRERLGMPAEPNIATLDPIRLGAASESGWDVDVPDRALW